MCMLHIYVGFHWFGMPRAHEGFFALKRRQASHPGPWENSRSLWPITSDIWSFLVGLVVGYPFNPRATLLDRGSKNQPRFDCFWRSNSEAGWRLRCASEPG